MGEARRPIIGFDTTSDVSLIVDQAVQDGYTLVGRYLSQSWKGLTRSEAAAIHAAGAKLLLFFETAPTGPQYFTGANGRFDVSAAHAVSVSLGAPRGTGWTFTVDYDAASCDLERIVTYFSAVRTAIQQLAPGEPMPYQLGAYGDDLVIEALKSRGLVEYTVRAGASKWFGNPSFQADVVQSPPCTLYGMSADRLRSAASELAFLW